MYLKTIVNRLFRSCKRKEQLRLEPWWKVMPYSSQEHNSHVDKRGPPIDREHHSHNGWNPPPQQGYRPGSW
ncbi:unnamed protein product [Haemonchus placei]|uniref:Secreted protein n=1 Tax=Haemonchus placei TaxID=6290 RepID=A0A0N4XAL1_HAEPC|nr:unnamed protein product [Haemonchus placei]